MLGILGGLVLLLLGILCLFLWLPWIIQFFAAIITILLIAGGVIAVISGIKANEEKSQAEQGEPEEKS